MVEKDEQCRTSRESRRDSVREEAAEPQLAVGADGEKSKKGEAPATTASPSTSVDILLLYSNHVSVCVRTLLHTNIYTILSTLLGAPNHLQSSEINDAV